MTLPKLQIPPMNNLRHISDLFPIFLGSASPRRKDLLQQTQIPFTVVTADVPEDIPVGEAPDVAAKRLAELKARHVSKQVAQVGPTTSALIISADTIVWHDGDCLGKPEDEAIARKLLHRLRGKTHKVFTAVSLMMPLFPPLASTKKTLTETAVAETAVTFKNVSDEEIEGYIATGDPLDKAGAYGAQELGAFLVDHIEGELDTVIGFPLVVVDDLAGVLVSKIPDNWLWGKY